MVQIRFPVSVSGIMDIRKSNEIVDRISEKIYQITDLVRNVTDWNWILEKNCFGIGNVCILLRNLTVF